MAIKILWLSRHEMTSAQLQDLHRIYGEIEIKPVSETVPNAQAVLAHGADCEILAVVLPPNILADLVNPRTNTKPVIRAISNRVETGAVVINPDTGKEEKQYRFDFGGWEQVLKIEVVTKRL